MPAVRLGRWQQPEPVPRHHLTPTQWKEALDEAHTQLRHQDRMRPFEEAVAASAIDVEREWTLWHAPEVSMEGGCEHGCYDRTNGVKTSQQGGQNKTNLSKCCRRTVGVKCQNKLRVVLMKHTNDTKIPTHII